MTPVAEYTKKASNYLLRAARAESAELTDLCMKVALAYQTLADACEALAQWEEGKANGEYLKSRWHE